MATTKPFHMSRETIDIERLAELKLHIATLTAEHNKIEQRLRRKLGRRVGLTHAFTAFEGVAKTFDYVKAKRKLGADVYEKCWKETAYISSRLTTLKRSE